MRYFLRHSPDPRPTLVVQTSEHVDDATVRTFRDLLYGMRCSSGLLFDPEQCRIIRDTFTSLDPESLQVETTIPTDEVLRKVERSYRRTRFRDLDHRVSLWLEVLAARWEDALPDDPALADPFITDIVLAAAEARISAEDTAA